MVKKRVKKKSVKKKTIKKKLVKRKSPKKRRVATKKNSEPKQPTIESKTPGVMTNVANATKRIFRKVAPLKNLPRVATGISGFDKMIEGGFKAGTINLASGATGSGKSILALEFLLQGIKKGENVLYITFEEKKKEFYSNMKKFGWDLAKPHNFVSELPVLHSKT